MKPKKAKNCTKIDRLPADRPRLAKTRGSSSGCSRAQLAQRRSPPGPRRRAPRPARVRAGEPAVVGRLDDRVHQRDQAEHGEHGAADVEARARRGSADSGTNRRVPTRATPASTTFSPNTDGHDQTSSSSPEVEQPEDGGAAGDRGPDADRPGALLGGKVPVIVDSVAGMTSAAPRPRTARRAISSVAESAVIATADPPPKIASPASSASRRP